MSAQSMLEQLLKSGLGMLQGQSGGRPLLGEFGKGAALGGGVGGALGLLLGSKRGRSYGGKALKYGSIAALGLMAYKAYSHWQAQQEAAQTGAGNPTPRTVDRLPAPEVEEHSRAMLLAMLAAARSDGHLDARETELLQAELRRLEADTQQLAWYEDALRRPLEPAEVARMAQSPEMAAEMYLASLLVVDETSFMERAYLDELARQLKLPDSLKTQLESQALSA